MAQQEATNTQVFSYNLFANKSIYLGNRKHWQIHKMTQSTMQKLSYTNQQELIHCKKTVILSK